MRPDALDYDTVETALFVWEVALLNGKSVVTDDLVAIWLASLGDENVTRVEFSLAAAKVMKSARYGLPKPVDVLDAVQAIRRTNRDTLTAPLRMAIDPRGDEVFAPADRVDENGFLIVPGFVPSPPGPPRALPAPAVTLTGDDRVALLRAMTPIRRRAHIRLLTMEGEDVTAYNDALRMIADSEREGGGVLSATGARLPARTGSHA